jgi:hypothetical protein
MTMRSLFLSIAIAVSALICSGTAFAKTASCPCNPCTCGVCTCGQSKSSSSKQQPTKTTTSKPQTAKTETKGHHGGKEHGHGHDHGGGVGVGVGVNVDLGGIGQRRAEPDPFAVSGSGQPVAQTEEKPKTPKKPREVTTSNAFADVQLTGAQAKEENSPPGPINISDNAADSSSSLPQTQEKPKGKPTQTTYMDRELPKAFKELPTGYKLVKTESGLSFYAKWDGLRPGLPIVWNAKHGAWMPPGFVPVAGDEDRGFNQTSGQNCVWDEKSKQWIDTKTGKGLTYEQ